MSRYRFELARAEHDAALRRRMAEDWMEGTVAVSFRREPSYFGAARLQGDSVRTIACFETRSGDLIGMGGRATLRAYVNGEPRRIGYLADLRCHPAHRRGTLLARGYRELRALQEADPLPFCTSVVYDGNAAALRALCGGRAGLPVYRNWGRLLTPALFLDRDLPAIEAAGVEVAAAQTVDLSGIATFLDAAMSRRQFAPVPDPRDFGAGRIAGLRAEDLLVARRGRDIVGTIALWDQSALRQTHVEGYRGWMGRMRPLLDAWRALRRRPSLPAPGARIPAVYFACFAAAGDDLRVGAALLRAAYRRARVAGWQFGICGLHERDPLAVLLARYARVPAAGHLFVVHYPEAAGEVAALDDRVPYLEAGCL